LIDFDKVERHNLDRLVTATKKDIGVYKVDVAKRRMQESATASKIKIDAIKESISAENGYRAALDCDVLFCCVDKPWAREVLNHIAYCHLIPVIDGGILVRFKGDEDQGFQFDGADWQVQTASPGRICLRCLGNYTSADVVLEKSGMLEDPAYIKGLPKEVYRKKNNENVFPFSANLASLEVFHLVALATGAGEVEDFGVQRFRYNPGIVSQYTDKCCEDECDFEKSIGVGDRYLTVYTPNPQAKEMNIFNKVLNSILSIF
jgi:molybdopterin-synthase adenylyltransferase